MELPDFLLIPCILLKDKEIKALDGHIFGLIYWCSKLRLQKCIISNKAIAEIFSVQPESVQNSITRLSHKGYIQTTYNHKTHQRELIPLIVFSIKESTTSINDVLTPSSLSTPSINDVAPHLQMVSTTSIDDNVPPQIGTPNKKNIIRIKNIYKNNHLNEENDLLIEALLSYWNTLYNSQWKSVSSLRTNYAHWLNTYKADEIKQAVFNIKNHEFWRGKITPSILLRQKNPRQEAVDYIGELLNIKTHTPTTSNYVKYEDLVAQGKIPA